MQVEAELTVTEGLQNGAQPIAITESTVQLLAHSTPARRVVASLRAAFGTLHGGATCTIIDVAGTLALLSLDTARPGVSVELNSSFVAAAKAGEKIRIVASVLKTGKRLGFTHVDIYGADDRLCATGRHTKAL